MRIARADNLTDITKAVTIPTPPMFEQGVKVLVQNILQLQDGPRDTVEACIIGIAGTLNGDHSQVFNSPNLQGWEHMPLKSRLENELHCHIHIENDVALAGLGEAVYGAGRSHAIVAYLTVSTGTGGARIVNGYIDQSAFGFEPGRHIIRADDPEFKSLGRYVSGAELKRTVGLPPQHIEDPKVWDNVARYLAYGIYNIVMFWSPHIIVLGGGLIIHEAIQLDRVRTYYEERMAHTGKDVFPFVPSLVRAELADSAGLYGGLVYIRNRKSHFS
jgi:predicted NBD/HSP70 family sugar kinase